MTQPIATELRPLGWFKPDSRELARHADPEKTRLLGEDMAANGQLQAVAATEDGRLIFGHGRLLAAQSAGMKTLEVKIYPASLTDTQFRLIRAAENLQRTDLTGYQKWLLCSELLCGNPSWRQRDLAQALHFSESMISRFLSPAKCPPAAQQALAEGKIDLAHTYEISKAATPEEQERLLGAALNGASRAGLAEARQKPGPKGDSSQVRANRIRIELASGSTVTIAGKELSLDDAIQATVDAGKRLRAGRDQGLTARTISRVSAEVARKGEQDDQPKGTGASGAGAEPVRQRRGRLPDRGGVANGASRSPGGDD